MDRVSEYLAKNNPIEGRTVPSTVRLYSQRNSIFFF